jgi:hypothetical protein
MIAEEAMVLGAFGGRYKEYMARTWRLIPYVYRAGWLVLRRVGDRIRQAYLEARCCRRYDHPEGQAGQPRRGATMQMTQTSIPRWQIVTGWVLSGILALLFLPSAFFKIA